MSYPSYWEKIACRDWCEIDGMIWMVLSDRNSICEIEKATGKITFIAKYPETKCNDAHLSVASVYSMGKIVFVPLAAKHIAIVDVKSKNATFIPLKSVRHKKENYIDQMKFRNGFSFGNYVFLLGFFYPAIIRINVINYDILYIDEWVDDVEKYIHNSESNGYFKLGLSYWGDYVDIPMGCCGNIFEFHPDSLQYNLIPIGGGVTGVGSLTAKGNVYYMTGKNRTESEIIIWERENAYIHRVRIPNAFYYPPLLTEGKIYLFPMDANEVFEVDGADGTVRKNEMFSSVIKNNMVSDLAVLNVRVVDDLIVFQTGGDRKWHEYNVLSNNHRSYEYVINKSHLMESWRENIELRLNSEQVVSEGIIGLDDFISYIEKH